MGDIAIFTVLIFLSAFFSSSETAYFSLTHARVRLLAKEKGRIGKLVQELKRDPQGLLITILIGNNIVNLFTASYATVVATKLFASAALGIATGVTTLLILVFGEIIPKSFAYASNAKFAMFTAWPIYICRVIFTPLVWILVKMSSALSRIAGHAENNGYVTEDEIRTMSRMSVENGDVDYREHEMIENIFRFDETKAGEVMTPWYRVVTLNGQVPVEQIAHFVSHEGYSRYPVHDGRNEEKVIGYVHINHLMRALNSEKRDQPVKNFVVDIPQVSDEMSIERIFRSMLRERTHLYLVHEDEDKDEIIGLVTLEDIVEEILGEIIDETDEMTERI